MPLPIRDGNQSLTTLSTILVSNSHIPAHTVVSLGTQAITDIATAVSGVELGPNTLNALENITVTLGQVTITGGLTDAQLRASAVTIGGVVTATISGTASVTFGTAVVTGSASILNFPAIQTVTFGQAPVTFGTAVITGSTSILNFPATQSVTFGTSVVTGSVSVLNIPATQTVTFSQAPVTFGTAVVTGSTSILNFPATQTVTFSQASVTFGLISGTVTANPTGTQTIAGTVTANLGLNELSYVKANINITQTAFGDTLVSNVFLRRIGQYKYQSISGWANGEDESYVEIELKAIAGFPDAQLKWQASSFGALNNFPDGTFADVLPQNAGSDNGDPFPPTTFTPADGFTGTMTVSYEQPSIQPISGTVTIGSALPAGTNRIGVVTIGAGTVTLGAGTAQIGSVTASISGTVPISISSVTVGNSITIGSLPALVAGTAQIGSVTASISTSVTIASLPAISGTVTANLNNLGGGYFDLYSLLLGEEIPVAASLGSGLEQIGSVTASLSAGTNRIGVVTIGGGTVTIGAGTAQIGSVTASISNSLTISSLPAISGTVTANVSSQDIYQSTSPTAGSSFLRSALYYENLFGGTGEFVRVNDDSDGGLPVRTSGGQLLGISGTVTANVPFADTFIKAQGGIGDCLESYDETLPQAVLSVHVKNFSNEVFGSTPFPISGTVTANSSNGSLTTGFGSVTTANTAFATSAVTNANRKYLLIQNITTASNVITVGIGFTPTTTQGIQLFAGAGLTFEGTYIPTGAVNLLSSVTASCYTILEA